MNEMYLLPTSERKRRENLRPSRRVQAARLALARRSYMHPMAGQEGPRGRGRRETGIERGSSGDRAGIEPGSSGDRAGIERGSSGPVAVVAVGRIDRLIDHSGSPIATASDGGARSTIDDRLPPRPQHPERVQLRDDPPARVSRSLEGRLRTRPNSSRSFPWVPRNRR